MSSGLNLGMRFTQRRLFSSCSSLLRQKSLVDKIRAAPGSRNDLSLRQSTSLFWSWLTTPTRKLLQKYEDAIVDTIRLPNDVRLTRQTVAGLHEFHISANGSRPVDTPTLLVHGHAAAGVLYHRNFAALSNGIKDLYTVDFPDIGLSDKRPLKVDRTKQRVEFTKEKSDQGDRVRFKISQNKERNTEQVKKVENYYADSLEQWRVQHGFEKINLVSHSFGALMSFKYALKYPERVNRLVLCSPAGVERNLFSLNNNESTGYISDDPCSTRYFRPPFVPNFIAALGFNITKALGPFGIQLISKYLSMRYSRGSSHDEQVKLLVRYTVALFHQRNNSYKNLKVVLNNQLLALDPILDNVKSLKVPTSIIYGSYDWMNSQAGYGMYKEIEAMGVPAWFSVINNAGHNVFLDNSEEYDRQVLEFLKSELQ